jgi:hypothetical protein
LPGGMIHRVARQRLVSHRHPLGQADQVEAKSPEVSGVGGALPAARVSREVGAFHYFAGLAGGIDQPCHLGPREHVAGHFSDDCRWKSPGFSDSFAPSEVPRQIPEPPHQMGVGEADPFWPDSMSSRR